MRRTIKQAALFLMLATLLVVSFPASARAQVTELPGTLPDGATFLIEVPANWNGTLFLYSHGYVVPGSANPAQDVGDPATRAFMLFNGFALAGSSYAHTGWALKEALMDQIEVLDVFDQAFGHPRQTIAWGHSLGGIITAGLIQRNPHRFDAALPMCGVLSGGVATWNTALDAEVAFSTLIAPQSGLQLVNITNPIANLDLAEAALAAAQATPQGRARIALGAALGNTPGWFTPLSPEPAATDFASQEANQFLWDAEVDFPFVFAFRAELEARAGGNVSWTTGVNFEEQFERSRDRDEVRALYKEAGLNLHEDLEALNHAARIKANPEAVEYLERNIIFNGRIHIPVLTLHTTGDGLVVVENESAYKDVVDDAGNEKFLRREFVHRAGHCTFTPAETIAAVGKLLTRLDTGKWPDSEPADLNAAAAALGPNFNIFPTPAGLAPTPPAFFEFRPGPYLRPFDAFSRECEFGFGCH
ncbi:MAG TPA: prolyl oligopeptidase family serine peptidase [Candidatus Limnocylindria bacterium]|nr:prolyl oligopeptidase family serine peptidase [Candidatus Limnocylindria bacterium]